jgi:hypothetical protein
MTKEEAQAFLTREIVVYDSYGETVSAFREEDDPDNYVVYAPDKNTGSHVLDGDDVIEVLTVQDIVDAANP